MVLCLVDGFLLLACFLFVCLFCFLLFYLLVPIFQFCSFRFLLFCFALALNLPIRLVREELIGCEKLQGFASCFLLLLGVFLGWTCLFGLLGLVWFPSLQCCFCFP